jgi:hypothetical protein
MKILLHAEAFGFGPAALIRRLLPHIQFSGVPYGFLGVSHTSDLMSDCGLSEMYAFHLTPADRVIDAIIDRYDVVITAMDWRLAAQAKARGKRVVFIDALAWFWDKYPESMKDIDLYIAQDFIGVAQRVDKESTASVSVVVPPMVKPLTSIQQKQAGTGLLNLGGLGNPYWTKQAPLDYARAIDAVVSRLPGKWIELASQSISSGCRNGRFQTSSPEQALALLASSEAAIMTGGLGNILDAAAVGTTPVLFLPAANDSQGRQLQLLKQQALLDGWVDWEDIGFQAIDYWKPQSEVMTTIETYLTRLSCSSVTQELFDVAINSQLTGISAIVVLKRFGR